MIRIIKKGKSLGLAFFHVKLLLVAKPKTVKQVKMKSFHSQNPIKKVLTQFWISQVVNINNNLWARKELLIILKLVYT